MNKKSKIDKFFVLKRNRTFEFIGINDLLVEIEAEEVFANSFVFDDFINEWVGLTSHSSIPAKVKEKASFLPETIEQPTFIPISIEKFEASKINDSSGKQDLVLKKVEAIGSDTGFIKNKMDQVFLKDVEILHYIKQINEDVARFIDQTKLISDDREKVGQLTSKLSNALIENDILKENLKKALLKIEILQNRVNENGHYSEVVHESRENKEVEISFEELQNGKTYEFSNESEWLVLKDGKTTGPMRFDELFAMKKSGELVEHKIRRKSELHWRDPEEVIELVSDVKLINENLKIPEKNIYKVERGEYRAEVRESVTFEIQGVEHKGILSNISLSGGFIELFKIDEFEAMIDKTGNLFLNEGLVSESIFCNFKIKRVSKNRPKGIGFSFVNVNAKNLEILGKLITSQINSKLNKAA